VRETLAVSERRACRVLGQLRRTQRYTPRLGDDEVWRRENNQVRPHSSLRYKPPAPEAASGPLIAATS
jgi:hypothetical protein